MAIVIVLVVGFLLRQPVLLVGGLIGLGLVGAGGWWLVTEQNPRRAIGIGGIVGRGGGHRLVGVRAFTDGSAGLWRLLQCCCAAWSWPWPQRVRPWSGTCTRSTGCARAGCGPRAPGADLQPEVRRRQGREVRPDRPGPADGRRGGAAGAGPGSGAAGPRRDRREVPTAWAWPAATGPRHWSRRSRSSTTSRSSASAPAPATTSRWTSGWTGRTPARAWSRFATACRRRVDYATVGDRLFVNNVSLGRLRHDRAGGRLPRRQGRDHRSRCSRRCWVGRRSRSICSSPTPDGARGRRRVRDPGVQQPLRAGAVAGRLAAAFAWTPAQLGVFAVNAATGAEAAAAGGARHGRPGQAGSQRPRVRPRRRSRSAPAVGTRLRGGRRRGTGPAHTAGVPDPSPQDCDLLVPAGDIVLAAEKRRARAVNIGALVATRAEDEPLAEATAAPSEPATLDHRVGARASAALSGVSASGGCRGHRRRAGPVGAAGAAGHGLRGAGRAARR